MKAYRYLQEADQEFQEHIGYFDGVSRAVALRFVDAAEAAVNEIRRHPDIGAPLTRLVRKRVLTNFKYNILYVNTAAEIYRNRNRTAQTASRVLAQATQAHRPMTLVRKIL